MDLHIAPQVTQPRSQYFFQAFRHLKRMAFLCSHLPLSMCWLSLLKINVLRHLVETGQRSHKREQRTCLRISNRGAHECIMCCGRSFIYTWTVTKIALGSRWRTVELHRTLHTMCLGQIRQDVLGRHCNNGGSSWDTREGTGGSCDVNMGVWKRQFSIHTMLHWKDKKIFMLAAAVVYHHTFHTFKLITLWWGVITLSRPEAMMRKAAGLWCPRGVAEEGRLLACRISS